MYSHPLEEWTLYVVLGYIGNFTKRRLEKVSNYTLRHISGKSYGFSIILEAFKKKDKKNSSAISGNILLEEK